MNARQHTGKRIGELLLGEGLISKCELSIALVAQKKQGGKLVSLLIDMGCLSHRSVDNFLARQGIASIDLDRYQINPQALGLLPQEYVIEKDLMPIDKIGNLLTVAMVCPLDRTTIEQVECITGCCVTPLLCSAKSMRKAIIRYYGKDMSSSPRNAKLCSTFASGKRLGSAHGSSNGTSPRQESCPYCNSGEVRNDGRSCCCGTPMTRHVAVRPRRATQVDTLCFETFEI